MEQWKDFWFAILHPSYWLSNYITDEIVDAFFKKHMKEGTKIDRSTKHTCVFAGKEVWISNFPYAFGHIMGMPTALPKRRTRKLFKDYVNRQLLGVEQ